MPSIAALAKGTPSAEAWRSVTEQLNMLRGPALEAAVAEFEDNSAHWPTRLDPWQGYSSGADIELRRSPQGWVKEIYAGLHSPKHRLIRVLDSPLRLKRGEALEHALGPDAQLPNLRQIAFDQSKLSGGFLKSWRGEGPWRRWEALRLWTCGLSPANLKLVAAADLHGMSMLNLEQNRFGQDGAAAMVKAPGFAALRALHLGNNSLDAGAAQALNPAKWLRALTWLDLGMNALYDSAMELLTANGALEALTTLNLSRCPVGADTSRWAASLPNLESLNLSNTALGDDGLVPFVEGGLELKHLRLDATHVGDAGLRALAKGRQRWRSLSLMSIEATAAGLGALLRSPSLQQVERLELGAGLTRENARLLADGACPSLKFLWWHGPELGEGAEALIRGDARLARCLPY
ncbi:hypothetical protein L6R49_20975 [Myxococcota bacterium]|nr:hypothetical protein [Myxococcota bacterium]